MKRRGVILFFLFSFLLCGEVKTENLHFLDFPFNLSHKIIQGWFYDNGNKHQGIDYFCNIGDPIYAPADGIAMSSSQDLNSLYSFGNFVFIDHENGFATLFAHLDKTNTNLKNYPSNLRNNRNFSEWTEIKKGDYLGDCGMTGTTNSHLHFESTNGFYAIDRFDSYDIYSTSIFYPFNSSYNLMGEKNIWSLNYLNIDSENKTVNNYSTPVKEDINLKNYKIEFLNNNQNLVVTKNSEVEIKVKIKNLAENLEAEKTSFNVIGGIEKNKIFKHNSWITDLRPSLLNININKNEEKEFSFLINTPNELGQFIFEFVVVENNTWKKIDSGQSFKINFQIIEDDNEKKIVEDYLEKDEEKNVDKNILIKIKDDFLKKTEEVLENIKNFFVLGGGNSNSSIDDQNLTNDEDDEENNSEELDYSFSLDFPTSSFYVTNTANIFLSGSKSSNLEKIFINSSSQEIYFTSSTWKKEIFLNQGDNLFNIFSEKTTSTVNLNIRYEKILSLPEIEIQVLDEEKHILHIFWQSENADFFDLEIKRNSGDWQNISSKISSTDFTTSTRIDENFYVRVRGRDQLDNVSEWVYENYLFEYEKTVVINEIAWMGVSSDRTNYEWIELYNNTENEIDLTGWNLFIENFSGTSTTIPLSGLIKKDGYFLLARNSDVFKDVDENLLFNFSLHNSGAKLVLFDNEKKIIDESDQKDGWFAGNTIGKYRSSERIDSKISGNFSYNWQTNEIFHYKSESKGNLAIYASPGQSNNSLFYIPDNFLSFYPEFWGENDEFIFKKENSPYLFNDFVVPLGKKVIIEPGVILFGIFNESKIIVEGEMELNGEDAERIYFTSRFDDIYNKNNLGFYSNSGAGNWQNIEVKKDAKFSASFVDFRFGGYKDLLNGQYYSNVFRNFGGEIILDNVKIEKSFSNTNISEKNTYIYNSGILKINDSFFSNGYNFLYSTSGDVEFMNNSFENFNSNYILNFENNLFKIFDGNNFSSSSDKILVSNFLVDEEKNIYENTKYSFYNLTINPAGILNIFAGSEVSLRPGAILNISGSLNVFGEENKKAIIKGDGNFSAIFVSNGIFNANFLDIIGGGFFAGISFHPIANVQDHHVLWLKNAQVNLENTNIFGTRRPGAVVYAENSSLNLKNSYLGWNTDYEKNISWYDNGINLKSSNLFLDNVTFQKMDVSIKNSSGSVTNYLNMSEDNFLDLYCRQNVILWSPANLFPFNPCSIKNKNTNIFFDELLLRSDIVYEEEIVKDQEEIEELKNLDSDITKIFENFLENNNLEKNDNLEVSSTSYIEETDLINSVEEEFFMEKEIIDEKIEEKLKEDDL